MNKETRKEIGLLRHKIISPVLMETGREQMTYFREAAKQEYEVPGYGKKFFAVETMKGWLRRYRAHGFSGITPKERSDIGRQRLMTDDLEKKISSLRQDHLLLSCAKFHRFCLSMKILGEPPICMQTLRRFLKANQLFSQDEKAVGRKRYEMDFFGELWVSDFMHGPELKFPKKGKAILLGIIDDYSRMIVGFRWGQSETTLPIEQVFKEALLTYGKPNRIYVDNGPSFSSSYLREVCASCGISLVHSKPYDSPSRGKIERFWRTVRESFLSDFKGTTLSELNEGFKIWLRDDYHQVKHNGIQCRPLDRFQMSISEFPRARISEEALEEFFLVKIFRKVNKDATVSVHNLIYEVPPRYIGKKIELRYNQESKKNIFLYEGDVRIMSIKVVDVRANGKSYKPKNRNTVVQYHKEKV